MAEFIELIKAMCQHMALNRQNSSEKSTQISDSFFVSFIELFQREGSLQFYSGGGIIKVTFLLLYKETRQWTSSPY